MVGGSFLEEMDRDEIIIGKEVAGGYGGTVNPPPDRGPVMYVARMDAFLNRWFTTYAAARESLDSEGGYLLPYRTQFFVTVAGAIRELGLDPDDPDWALIGRDWVRPNDPEARARLERQRLLAI